MNQEEPKKNQDPAKKHPGTENLVSLATRPEEERKHLAHIAGIKSGEARRNKRDLRQSAKAILEILATTDKQREVLGSDSKLINQFENVTLGDLLNMKMYQEASEGNTKAFEVLRDTAGYKPVENVSVDANIVSDQDKKLLEKLAQREGIPANID